MVLSLDPGYTNLDNFFDSTGFLDYLYTETSTFILFSADKQGEKYTKTPKID